LVKSHYFLLGYAPSLACNYKANQYVVAVISTLAFNVTELVTTVKRLKIQAHENKKIHFIVRNKINKLQAIFSCPTQMISSSQLNIIKIFIVWSSKLVRWSDEAKADIFA
jgi:hypothetical protein